MAKAPFGWCQENQHDRCLKVIPDYVCCCECHGGQNE